MQPRENSGSSERRGLAGVALAAGAGVRLRPLTLERPKPLCPVANRPLVDLAVERLAGTVGAVAVNVHHGRDQLEPHLVTVHPGVHVSVEEPVALGTAGALGHLRDWLDGRDVLVTNADAWLPLRPEAVAAFVAGWDGLRTRLLCVDDPERGDFGDLRYCGLALVPWAAVALFDAEPSGLYERSWGAEWEAGRLDLVRHDGPFVDCATPADYLFANLAAAARPGNGSIISPDAVVQGEARDTVVWSLARVWPGESLRNAIRTPNRTVLIR